MEPDPDTIYLDYAATTPVDPAVARTIGTFLGTDGIFGNPASRSHHYGQAAADAVETARGQVASLLGCEQDEIIWTSGATEAINFALKGVALSRRRKDRGHIVTSVLEHRAVLDTVQWLETRGFTVSYLRPDAAGLVTEEQLSGAMQRDTILVSLMHVNNETGVATDVAALAPLVHRSGALLHVDAAQSAARVDLKPMACVADLVSISGHKMYGPKGVGALRVRRVLQGEMTPQLHGGGHERGLRSGTLPTHRIAGMGHAAALIMERRESDVAHVADLDARLIAHMAQVDGAEVNGNRQQRVPGILNVHYPGVEAESLMLALGGVAVSSGSACTSAEVGPSHVLLGLGYSPERSLASIRFSFGRFTTREEIERTVELVMTATTALRSIAR